MRYVSLDIETTGLRPQRDQILQLAMVVEDSRYPEVPVTELPYFCCLVKHEEYQGNAYALSLNAWILDLISGRVRHPTYPIYTQNEMVVIANAFLNDHLGLLGQINVAGKNAAGFDIPFLPTALSDRFRHRVIDPGSVFVDWSKDRLPALGDLLDAPVSHDALGDARDVITCLRRSYNGTQK